MSITLTPMQQTAVDMIKNWYNYEEKTTFFLAGYAGTGKTTLVEYAINELNLKPHQVAFACYTGKAALVLSQRSGGKIKARTIHKLIYEPVFKKNKVTGFQRRSLGALSNIDLIVIDEASMVDGNIMKDLYSFNKKILFLGDIGQLPPVDSESNQEFLKLFKKPEFLLTEIHRQAQDNPIIKLSMLARTGQPIPYGSYGENKEVLVIDKQQWDSIKYKMYRTADQIICGKNTTRKEINMEARKVHGHYGDLPQNGDKLICIRNNWDKVLGSSSISMVNGMTGFASNVKTGIVRGTKFKKDVTTLDFTPDFTDESFKKIAMLDADFKGVEGFRLTGKDYSAYCGFDFGYAVTCHKSQGSQWDNVVVISEVLNRQNHHRWLYTAITRSSKRLILVI